MRKYLALCSLEFLKRILPQGRKLQRASSFSGGKSKSLGGSAVSFS